VSDFRNSASPPASKFRSDSGISPPADPRPDDIELVRQAREGDAAAFGALVERYQDRIYNAIYRMCNHDADALDLTQSAFLKALEGLPRFREDSRFLTWLYRIAMNEVLSHRRSRVRRRTFSLQAMPDGDWSSAEPEPAACLNRDETQQRVTAALERLEPEFRAAVILKDIEGLDYATIAQVLGVPVGTVKSRLFRGRMMLRSALRGTEIAGDV